MKVDTSSTKPRGWFLVIDALAELGRAIQEIEAKETANSELPLDGDSESAGEGANDSKQEPPASELYP